MGIATANAIIFDRSALDTCQSVVKAITSTTIPDQKAFIFDRSANDIDQSARKTITSVFISDQKACITDRKAFFMQRSTNDAHRSTFKAFQSPRTPVLPSSPMVIRCYNFG